MANGRAEADSEESIEELPAAGPHDQAYVQRATTSCIVPIKSLGQGAFAQVDLCHVPVGTSKKLLVRKMLVPGSRDGSTGIAAPSPLVCAALKPSSAQDWTREASMHRQCDGCPFVLQLLAAKRCRSGNLLLLLEYAALGSLTDILAARQQQLQPKQQQVLALDGGPAADTQALQSTAAAQLNNTALKAAAGSILRSSVVETLLPLAVSAAELVEEHSKADAAKAAAIIDLEQQQLAAVEEEEPPVFVAFMPELLAEAEAAVQHQEQRHQQQHDTRHTSVIEIAAPLAAPQDAHAAGMAMSGAAAAAGAVLGPATFEHHGLPEEAAKFFAGCILMALQWMHSKRMLHRDIKPCNLLLFGNGYLKLADLGCCCQLPPGVSEAQTRTGTAAYMAPEVLGQAPYSYPVDMWSLGVTIWQMVAGCLPDWAEERQEQRQQEQQWWDGHPEPPEPMLFPSYFSQELRSLLSGLLHHDSAARLKLDDVMASDWFAGFDWQALRDRTLTPPAVL